MTFYQIDCMVDSVTEQLVVMLWVARIILIQNNSLCHVYVNWYVYKRTLETGQNPSTEQ